MMLMLEQWDSSRLELAMLLDEAPYHRYRATNSGEPCRAGSRLTEALRAVDLGGSAWLFVVYRSDPPSTWGSKRVKLLGGGEIVRAETTRAGVSTGRYRQLRFEVVARDLFHNIVGKDSEAKYKLIKEARIAPGSDEERRARRHVAQPDPLFGLPEKQADKPVGPYKPPPFFPPEGLGCVLTWQNQNKYSETWFVGDSQAFGEYQFQLTEYQRRPFVQVVMSRLGFVRVAELGENGREPRLEEGCAGHLQTLVMSLGSLLKMASNDRSGVARPTGKAQLDVRPDHRTAADHQRNG